MLHVHLLSQAGALPRTETQEPPLASFRGRQPSREIQESSLSDETRNKTGIKHLQVVARRLEQPPAVLEAREPVARISLKERGCSWGACGSPRGWGGPAGDQPSTVLLRDPGQASAALLVITLLVVTQREAESARLAPKR